MGAGAVEAPGSVERGAAGARGDERVGICEWGGWVVSMAGGGLLKLKILVWKIKYFYSLNSLSGKESNPWERWEYIQVIVISSPAGISLPATV